MNSDNNAPALHPDPKRIELLTHQARHWLGAQPRPQPSSRFVWEAGSIAGAFAERIGLLAGRMVRTPLQLLAGVIAGEVE